MTLVVNAGSSERAKRACAETPGDEDGLRQSVQNGGENTDTQAQVDEEQCDSHFSSTAASAPTTSQDPAEPPPTNTSYSSTQSDGLSSSQDTLDGITVSPASFEGDTDFSGMQNVLTQHHARGVLDLHRTSSAPLTGQEMGAVLDSSSDSCPSSTGRAEGRGEEEGGSPSYREGPASLDCVDGPAGARGQGYEARLNPRTSSDGTVERAKKQVCLCLFVCLCCVVIVLYPQRKNPKHHLPP